MALLTSDRPDFDNIQTIVNSKDNPIRVEERSGMPYTNSTFDKLKGFPFRKK